MIRFPTLHTGALAAIEQTANRLLALDPASVRQLNQLSGQVFYLQCTEPKLDIYLLPGADGIQINGIYAGKPTTTLTGSASELLKLATADDPANALINGELTLQGDSNALIELQKILATLEIDWEAPLANLVGDVAAHQIGKAVRFGVTAARQTLASLNGQFSDYLRFESNLLPAHWQLEQFYQEVDQLHLRTERLQARLQRLMQNVPASSQP